MLKLFYTVVFAAIVQVSFCQGFDFDGMNQTDSLGESKVIGFIVILIIR